ncbi:MAG: 16S rRNA (guanine(966)-N(2))-methyltransferase RsmD [Magnetococcus sp. WYHC-3]
MPRITAGEKRGLRLSVPPGERVRPTTDQVRQAIFNILGARVVGARVLDLYAGSGALGLDALSRGAGFALFVDNHPESLLSLQDNLRRAGYAARAQVARGDALRPEGWQRHLSGRIDLVFLDPPYGQGLVPATLAVLATRPWLSENALVVAEFEAERLRDPLALTPAGPWRPRSPRHYGGTAVGWWEHVPPTLPMNSPTPAREAAMFAAPRDGAERDD